MHKFVLHILKCQTTNLQTPHYVQLHLEIPQIPIDFISMDLISPFEMTARGNQYALTVMCMLTKYVICIPLTDKYVDTVVSQDLGEVYCRLGGSRKILSDKGSEFKNSLFSGVITQLRSSKNSRCNKT